MRITTIALGLSAAAAAMALAACSSGGQSVAVADAATLPSTPSSSAAPTTTSAAPITTSTTTAAPVTTAPVTTLAAPPPVATRPTVQQAAAPAAPGVPCSAAAKACVDLSALKAWLVDNGTVVYGPVSIMPGSARFPTPSGTFHVLSKNAHYFSTEFHAPMPDSVFFYPGDAFHVGSLGVRSHGCIHLSWTSAAKFFNTLSVGDEVQILR